MEGPSQTDVQCRDDDGAACVTYLPPVAGEYAVHVLCNDEDITDSPFIVQVQPSPASRFDPSKVSSALSAVSILCATGMEFSRTGLKFKDTPRTNFGQSMSPCKRLEQTFENFTVRGRFSKKKPQKFLTNFQVLRRQAVITPQ